MKVRSPQSEVRNPKSEASWTSRCVFGRRPSDPVRLPAFGFGAWFGLRPPDDSLSPE